MAYVIFTLWAALKGRVMFEQCSLGGRHFMFIFDEHRLPNQICQLARAPSHTTRWIPVGRTPDRLVGFSPTARNTKNSKKETIRTMRIPTTPITGLPPERKPFWVATVTSSSVHWRSAIETRYSKLASYSGLQLSLMTHVFFLVSLLRPGSRYSLT